MESPTVVDGETRSGGVGRVNSLVASMGPPTVVDGECFDVMVKTWDMPRWA